MAAVDSAALAYQSWKSSPPSERRRLLLKAADALDARTPAFIEAMGAGRRAAASMKGYLGIRDTNLPYRTAGDTLFGIDTRERNFARIRA